jgi:glycosyltransferase involved in cell wall biosynthesis
LQKKKDKGILYIGNSLTKKTGYYSSMDLLSSKIELLEDYQLKVSSTKSNYIFRLLDMIWAVVIFQGKTVLIDVFSTKAFYYTLFCSLFARLKGIEYVCVLRGGGLPKLLNKSPYLTRLVFRNAKYLIAPSNYLKVAFEKEGYSAKLIPNIVEIENYQFRESIDLEAPKLLYVRAFDKIYNPLMALKVLEGLIPEYPRASLTMVGPDKDGTMEKVRSYADSKGLSKYIEITGVLSKPEWHRKSLNSNVFINTTHVDNTPVSVIEAMALGIPVVSTNVGGIPYLLDDGVDSILVGDDEHTQMIDAIKDLLSDLTKTEDLRIKARRKVERFSWEYIKEDWLSIL